MSNKTKIKNALIWVDCEMSGLNIIKDKLLEIAVVITHPDSLEIVAELGPYILHVSDEILDSMDEWCTKHHGESGLTERVR